MMKNNYQAFYSENADATYGLGVEIGKTLTDETVLLKGDMGAGKTLLTKGIVKGMGLADDVTSPTFALVNVYDQGDKQVHHFDLYRLTDPDELYEIGFEDYLKGDGVVIIEWPDAVEFYLDTPPISIEIENPNHDDTRRITLKGMRL